ncbi:carbon-nitrogen hydrolase family protein [Niallia oryzisoli]|uniref:Carbon-nitrogen hydrolase family protein n=1 Tax=Niallia oryzisoli TaxID=1737571 RepID=A0ABZ2CCM2_9BACI
MDDIITISTVNFGAKWGESNKNLKRILEYVDVLAKQGSQIIVFPETALTGYDDDKDKPLEEKMHRRLAETVPGPSSNAIAELTKKYGIYVLYGLAERETNDPTKVYNAAAICGPEGVIGTYRKIHLPFSEMNWADRGNYPVLFETPWGPVGVGICYDTYCFPEIMRYCRAMGARLFINCSAIGTEESGGAGGYYGNLCLEYLASTNDMYIATANLYGKDVTTYFMGGSSIIGPSSKPPHIHYYAGQRFLDPGADEGTVSTATLDLSCVENSFLKSVWEYNESIDSCDWRPELYSQWYEKILRTDFWAKPKNNHYISK